MNDAEQKIAERIRLQQQQWASEQRRQRDEERRRQELDRNFGRMSDFCKKGDWLFR